MQPADTETAPSIQGFAAIQDIKCKQNLAGLAVEAVERVVGQIGETQEATRDLSGGIGGDFGTEPAKNSVPFVLLAGAGSRWNLADSARPNSA